MASLIVREEAEAEIEAAFRWYEVQDPGLGTEFIRALEATLASIARSPEMYPAKYRHARQALLRRFPYSVIYIVTGEGIVEVVAVYHARRDPERWQQRLAD